MSMNYSAIKPFDIANGPGIRVSLFVSGCPHHCHNCFNPETWDYGFGDEFGYEETNKIIELLKQDGIAGFTILGGEPLAPRNVPYVATLINDIRKELPSVSIWVYTGYRIEELTDRWYEVYHKYSLEECKSTLDVLTSADVLVDGRFEEEKKDLKLRFRGSSNQRIINLKETLIHVPSGVSDVCYADTLSLMKEYM